MYNQIYVWAQFHSFWSRNSWLCLNDLFPLSVLVFFGGFVWDEFRNISTCCCCCGSVWCNQFSFQHHQGGRLFELSIEMMDWWWCGGMLKMSLFESKKTWFQMMNISILFIASIYVWFVLPFLCLRLQSWNSDQSIFWFMNKQKLPHVEFFHREQVQFGSWMGNRTISLSVWHDWGRDANKMVSFVCLLQINIVFGYILAKSFNNEPFSPQFRC